VRVLVMCSAVLGVMLAAATPAATQPAPTAAPRIAGTWRLNPQKSGVQVPADYVEVRQYRLRPDGFMVGLLFQGDSRGLRYLQFTAKSDGRDYPEYTDQLLADFIAAGRQPPRTYAERQIDEFVTEWVDKVDGRVTGKGRKIVSSDGATLTVTVDGQTQVRVYDRQAEGR
jgi:hypothetical protein